MTLRGQAREGRALSRLRRATLPRPRAVSPSCLSLALAAFLASPALAEPTADVVVRRAPYVVSTVSSKSEKDWATCKYCGAKTSYERTYKWDVYNHKWIETTENVPEVCRSCKTKDKAQEKLDRAEAKLDREIEYYETKQRIEEKEKKLRRLRKATR